MARKWIQRAVRHRGALRRKAARRGMTVAQFCRLRHRDTRTRRQCNLFHTLRRLARRRRH